MENNLDDILIDSPKGQEKQEKSKRKILIGVASALLIAVVIVVIYFVMMKKEEPKGLEATHSELEKFAKPEVAPKSKEDEEFDKLIADIKARHSESNQTQISQSKPEEKTQGANEIQKVENSASKEDSLIQSKIEEMTKASQEESQITQKPIEQESKQIDKTQNAKEPVKQERKQIQKETKKQENQIQKPQKQSKKVEPKEVRAKKQDNKSQEKKTAKSASQTFNALEAKIPHGFYLQVGVFANKPNAEFLNQISNYPYKVEKLDRNGSVVERYLVGPFSTREQAQEKMEEVEEKVTKPIIVEIRQGE